jgi:hypothetical protein
MLHFTTCHVFLLSSVFSAGIMSAIGNGYVIYMTIKRKTKLRPPELMTVNLAIFDFCISGKPFRSLFIQYVRVQRVSVQNSVWGISPVSSVYFNSEQHVYEQW